MRKSLLTGSLLIFVLAISGCASNGVKPPPPVTCPRLQAPAPGMMLPSEAGNEVRAELFEPPTGASPR